MKVDAKEKKIRQTDNTVVEISAIDHLWALSFYPATFD